MRNDKYVVFKRKDWDEYLSGGGDDIPNLLEDAVVIRPQDIFAAPGLFAYASAIQTAIDLNYLQNGSKSMLPVPVSKLEDLRDFFFEQAQFAQEYPSKKFPD